jgi:hypothetical protein
MKRIAGIVCLLCGLSATAQTPEEAVGINTENPQGVLHIDGASTAATTNPQTGAVSALQASDDVVIDAEGRLGVGVVAPAARVHIYTATPGEALRIADGTEGEDKVLASDADGAGQWISIGAQWYAVLHTSDANTNNQNVFGFCPYINYASSLISSAGQGSLNTAAGTITVPYAGAYRITFSVHYMSNRTGTSPYWAASVLYVNNVIRWTPSIWGTASGNGSYPSFTVILNLNVNDVLRLAQDQRESFSANFGQAGVGAFMVELIQ